MFYYEFFLWSACNSINPKGFLLYLSSSLASVGSNGLPHSNFQLFESSLFEVIGNETEIESKMTSLILMVRLDSVDGGVRCNKSQWIIMVVDFFPIIGASAR